MTNKELRIKIYSWLKESFNIDFDVIDSKKRNELKKILKEFNPTQETEPRSNKDFRSKPEINKPIKVELYQQRKPTKPLNKYNTRVWREGM